MKANTHPNWHQEAKVSCACGNTFTTGSTVPEIHVEVCSACHPFFTGQMRYVDTAGRVDKFREKMTQTGKKRLSKKEKRAQKKAERIQRQQEGPASLEELRTTKK